MIHGLLRIDKPAGLTSAAVLDQIKNRWSEVSKIPKRNLPKIGHSGTLDPFATGLLLVFIGNAVRLSEYFLKSSKTYIATAVLGVKTASGDLTMPIQHSKEFTPLALEQYQRAADQFIQQEYWQKPPMYSAVKVDGKRLYELARKGIEIERRAVLRKINSFKILDAQESKVTFEVNVDSGTYIRTLAEDWAESLGTIAALQSLRRTTVGEFDLQNVQALESWMSCDENFKTIENQTAFIHFDQILQNFPKVQLTEDLFTLFLNGNPNVIKKIKSLMLIKTDLRVVPVFFREQLLGTLHLEEGDYKFGKIFHLTPNV